MRLAAVIVLCLLGAAGCLDRSPPPVETTWQEVLGPEFATGVAPTRVRANGHQLESAVACDGTGTCLVVYSSSGALRANRIDAASGVVLDAESLPLTTLSSHEELDPAVAFGGGLYLVVWSRFGGGGNHDLVGLRVGTDGVPIDTAPFVISAGPNAELHADVAWGGGVFFATWTSEPPTAMMYDERVFGAVIDVAGTVTTPFDLSPTSTSGAMQPSVASDGASFLIAWGELGPNGTWDVRGRRVDATGLPIAPTFGIAAENPNDPARNDRDPDVGFAGGVYLVAWTDGLAASGTTHTTLRRLAADGTPVGAARTRVDTVSDYEIEPVVTADGTDFLVAYLRGSTIARDVTANVVSAAGAVSPPFVVAAFPRNQYDLDVARGGNRYLAVFIDDNYYLSYDVIGVRVSSAGVAEDPAGIAIATSLSSESAAVAAAGPITSLFTWHDNRPYGPIPTYMSRVDASGNLLDPPTVLPGPVWKDSIQIARAGSVWLLVFREYNPAALGPQGVYGMRIAEDGTVLDPVPFSLINSSDMEPPVVASNGTSFLVHLDTGTHRYHREIFTDGTMGPLMSLSISAVGPTSLAWNGSRYLLITRYNDLHARRVSSDGTLIDGSPIVVGDVPDVSIMYQRYAAVASDGTDWMIVFQPVPNVLHLRRVHDDGTMDPAITLASGPGLRREMSIAYDGAHYAVVHGAYDSTTMQWSRAYQWIAPDGTPYPGASGALMTGTQSMGYETTSSAGNGAVLATYMRQRTDGHSAHGRFFSCDVCVLPPIDAGVPDAPPIDAPPIDAGMPDAPPVDAAGIDAPGSVDAAVPADAPAAVDAPPVSADAPTPSDDAPDSGCGCGAQPSRTDVLPFVLLLLLLARRRHREPRE